MPLKFYPFCSWLIISWIAFIAIPSSTSVLLAKPAPSAASKQRAADRALKKAKDSFAKGSYLEANQYYRRYLRINPKDADVWVQFAVSYYFIAVPEKTIDLLKKRLTSTTLKSYSHYYMALAYEAIGELESSRAAFLDAAKYTDEFGQRATYDLAVIFYLSGDEARARYWAGLYLQRYPRGPYLIQAKKIMDTVTSTKILDDIKGTPRVQQEDARFKYHPRSLVNYPHFWWINTGYDYLMGSQVDPSTDKSTGITKADFVEQAFLLGAGFGIGPLRKEKVSTWLGYDYQQRWITDNDRIKRFTDESSSFQDYLTNFPYRPDLLERHHTIFGSIDYDISELFFANLYGAQEFVFIGSQIFPGPEGVDAEQKSQRVADISLLVPTIGVRYLKNYTTSFYLYMRKELNYEAKEFSTKTYNLFGSSAFVMSYGLRQTAAFPQYGIGLQADVFLFDNIYNDYWLDYTRTGMMLGMTFDIIGGLVAGASYAYLQDVYQLPNIRQRSCSGVKSKEDSDSDVPMQCPRTDMGTLFQAQINWNYTTMSRVGLKATMIQNSNPDQKVFDSNRFAILVDWTTTFPNLNVKKNLSERFNEAAYVKDQD